METKTTAPQEGEQTLLQEVESVESIIAREHEPEELQAKISQLLEALEGGDLLEKQQLEMAFLAQSRNRVKALLSHPHLQGEYYNEARDSLAKIKNMLHPMQAIGKMYGYSPHLETIPQLDLGINWEEVDSIVANSNIRDFDAINESSEGISTRGNERVKFFEKTLYQATLPCVQSKPLNLKGEKSIRKDLMKGTSSEQFILSLTNPNVPEDDFQHHYVGNFVVGKVDHSDYTEWNLNDRVIAEAYRSQGVAPKMLTMMEQMVEQYQETTDKPQKVTAEVGQVNVLIWLLKQGYTPESPSDQNNIDRLLKGDKSLVIASAPDDTEADEKRQWYIFNKATYEKNGDEVWNEQNHGKPIHHMKSSLRIRLKKNCYSH